VRVRIFVIFEIGFDENDFRIYEKQLNPLKMVKPATPVIRNVFEVIKI